MSVLQLHVGTGGVCGSFDQARESILLESKHY